MHYSQKRVHNSEGMKEELFRMMAIHPHFVVVEEVEKQIPLMFERFNQPLGMQLQHPSLDNDPLLNEVSLYIIPNILVYRRFRICHKPVDIPYLIFFYTILAHIFC
jgi:hypothetical protein